MTCGINRYARVMWFGRAGDDDAGATAHGFIRPKTHRREYDFYRIGHPQMHQ